MSFTDPVGKAASGSSGTPDPDVFAVFCRTHSERLMSLLRDLGADPADADHLAAETFSQAAGQWSTIRVHSWPWLAAIASNRYLSYYESSNQDIYGDEGPERLSYDEDPAAQTDPGKPLQEGRQLSPRQQEIVDYKAEGHSNAEIAERLRISNSTVRSQMHRVRQKPTISSLEDWPSSSFIGQLPEAERAALLDGGTLLRFEDDQILLVQGDVGDFLYVLLSGLVKVIVAAVSGAQTTLAVWSRGDLVGEFALLDNKPRTATARAAGPVTALKVDGAAFLTLAGRSPAVQATVTRYLLDKMRATTERRAAERVWEARERIAQVLYELGQKHAHPDSDGMIRIPITQSELGELAGVAVSTAERVLKDLRKQGIVSTRYRDITIRDMAYLRSIRFAHHPDF